MKWICAILLVCCALVILLIKITPVAKKSIKMPVVSPSAEVVGDFVINCNQSCKSIVSVANDGRMTIKCICTNAEIQK